MTLETKRPLSPHLQIYKIQITSFLSILHRATGVLLFCGSILWAVWFIVLSMGPHPYKIFQQLLLHPLGLIILGVWSFSFFYHLCNGMRHLMWDLGYGFDMKTVRFTGWMVVISSILLTLMAWGIGFLCGSIWS